VNARIATERQWAALIVRQPAARHTLLKWLRAYSIEPHWFQFEDPHAGLIYRAVMSLIYTGDPVSAGAVAAYLAGHDFTMTPGEARTFIDGLLSGLPEQVDVERMALATLAAMGITFPEHDVNDYLIDPLGRRAELMISRKVREFK